MKKIFYLMGKSASGKDTIYTELKKELPDFHTLVGYTTRPMREGEQEGREYHFTDEAGLKDMESKGIVIEKRIYHTMSGDWIYFTADDGQAEEGDYFLLIGTLESYVKVRDYFGKNKVLPIYIEVEDGDRLMRAIKREMQQKAPKYDEICRRFLADQKDFGEEQMSLAGIGIRFYNRNLRACIDEIKDYIISKK